MDGRNNLPAWHCKRQGSGLGPRLNWKCHLACRLLYHIAISSKPQRREYSQGCFLPQAFVRLNRAVGARLNREINSSLQG